MRREDRRRIGSLGNLLPRRCSRSRTIRVSSFSFASSVVQRLGNQISPQVEESRIAESEKHAGLVSYKNLYVTRWSNCSSLVSRRVSVLR